MDRLTEQLKSLRLGHAAKALEQQWYSYQPMLNLVLKKD